MKKNLGRCFRVLSVMWIMILLVCGAAVPLAGATDDTAVGEALYRRLSLITGGKEMFHSSKS